MNEKLLNQTIDESLAEAILGKLSEYKSQLDAKVARASKSDKAKLFKQIDKIVEERESDIKEEYSARVITKLKEKNEYIHQLEESLEKTKEELSERVNAFLTNSKEELRSLVEEEVKVDSETLKAARIVDEIRSLVGTGVSTAPVSSDDGKSARLVEDIQVLKERVSNKEASIGKLKAQLKVYELVESVPTGDRDFYIAQLKGAQSVTEAEETFSKVKKAIRASRVQSFESEAKNAGHRGVISEDRTDHSPRVPNTGRQAGMNFMKKLAGIE